VAALLAANPVWAQALQARTGRAVIVRPDAGVTGAGHAQ
jgi:hypothetical protein